MFSIFGKKDGGKGESQGAEASEAQQQYAAAPGTDIRFHPELIDNLKSDHRDLLKIYGDIKDAYESKNFQELSGHLREFRTLFNGHILTENIRLYVYLDRMLSKDPANASIIHDFKKEMNEIGIAVHNFLKKYETIGDNHELAFAFGNEFSAIGKVLGKRINQEENVLYPLYSPYSGEI